MGPILTSYLLPEAPDGTRPGRTGYRPLRDLAASSVALLVLLGCTHTTAPAPRAVDPAKVVWRYGVRATDASANELVVEARFDAGASNVLRVDGEAAPFVHDVSFESNRQWAPATAEGSGWYAPCRAAGCHIRYRFTLREAATKLDDVDTAVASGDFIVAPPSTWLLRPDEQPGRFQFRVSIASPGRIVAGTRPSPDGFPDTYEAPIDTLEAASFAALGRFHSAFVQRGAAHVEIAIGPYGLALSDGEVVSWVSNAVDAIAGYYGRFPVDRTLVVVSARKTGSSTRGETLGDGGAAVLIGLGEKATAASLRDDWVMTHELLHVTLPSLPRNEVWLSEGLPSYVEPIARARVGLLAAERVWGDLYEGIPQGLPQSGDEGLERTHTWGRTYWGGALFCLLADVTIREQTANRRSLDDALRAVVSAGADVEVHWDIDHFLELGDRVTGTHVLTGLYRDMARAPGTVDLAALWHRLGVRVEGGRTAFDDGAPLAAVRRAITAGGVAARPMQALPSFF